MSSLSLQFLTFLAALATWLIGFSGMMTTISCVFPFNLLQYAHMPPTAFVAHQPWRKAPLLLLSYLTPIFFRNQFLSDRLAREARELGWWDFRTDPLAACQPGLKCDQR
jgi:hypothetical protein